MKQGEDPTVKILISCHKEIILPESPVYLPVHVGAEHAARPLPGMQPDNEGENISDRNFTFCELTAQYWAWKNLEADYIGLCHYRRFFCFDGIKRKSNDHFQIEEEALSEHSIHEYHLDDTRLILDEIKGYDLIAAPMWNVSKTIAPGGVKDSVADHMIAYGLFEREDLERLRSIIAQHQPHFLSYFDEYVNGNKYRGYNCYIMRKELFDAFCEFEFDVLLRFDERFDYDGITTTKKRICGYFGEILYSVFVEFVKGELDLKIKEVPLTFFFDTSSDPFKKVDTDDAVNIIWRYRDVYAYSFLPCIQSMFDVLDPSRKYNLIVLHEDTFNFPTLDITLPDVPENVSISHGHWTDFPLPDETIEMAKDQIDIIEPLILPWTGAVEDPYIWIDGTAVFTADPALVLERALEEQPAISGLRNILLQREMNKPKNRKTKESYDLDVRGECFVDSTVLVVDPRAVKGTRSFTDILDAYNDVQASYISIPSEKPKYNDNDTSDFRILFYNPENQAFRAKLMHALQIPSLDYSIASISTHFEDTVTWANESEAKAWKQVDRPLLVYFEYGGVPILSEGHYLSSCYWVEARKTSSYELLLAEMFLPKPDSALNRLLPAHTRRGQLARRVFHRVKG